jgi:hypothetical protein
MNKYLSMKLMLMGMKQRVRYETDTHGYEITTGV